MRKIVTVTPVIATSPLVMPQLRTAMGPFWPRISHDAIRMPSPSAKMSKFGEAMGLSESEVGGTVVGNGMPVVRTEGR